MKTYKHPELRLITAREHTALTAWDEWSFDKLEGLNAEESASLVGLDIKDNPEGSPD